MRYFTQNNGEQNNGETRTPETTRAAPPPPGASGNTSGNTSGSTPDNASGNATDSRDNHIPWIRPTPQKRESNLRAWLSFLALILFGAALWAPLRSLYYRRHYHAEASEIVNNSEHFVAIAYAGVADNAIRGSDDVSTAAFEAQIRTLRARGYTPVGLDDLVDFYEGKRLLPDKAVLTTFEKSRKSSYFDTHRILRQQRWRAVMGVALSPIRAQDPQALLWPYLRDMLGKGAWELAAQSTAGFEYIPAYDDGSEGPFFATPQWLAAKNRHEFPEEFRERIAKDHEDFAREFKREIKNTPKAFFFPYGDYGQHDERARFVRLSNLKQVEERYALGFTLGSLALNTLNSDPRALNRLVVDPAWSAEELADRLDAFQPLEIEERDKLQRFGTRSIIREWGDVRPSGAGLTLNAIPSDSPLRDDIKDPRLRSDTTGARAWMAGSDNFKDGFLSMRFHLRHGHFGVYLRANPGVEHVYVMFDENGRVGVRQKLPDIEEESVAADDSDITARSTHELLISLRGKLLYVRLNGKLLFGGRVLLRETPKPGMIGLGVWDRVAGVASADVIDLGLMPRREAIVTWTPRAGSQTSYLADWLREHAYRYSIMAPPWMDIFESTPQKFPNWDQEALSLIAGSDKSEIFPSVLIRQSPRIMRAGVDGIFQDLALIKSADGLFIDASAVRDSEVNALTNWLKPLYAGLTGRGLKMALRLPDPIARLTSAANMLQLFPGVLLVGDYGDAPFGLPRNRVFGIESVQPPSGSETLSLYYQISNIAGELEGIAPEAVNDELRRRGFDAFAANDYEGAIKHWSEWRENDPANGEIPGLIGDAYLRMNAHEKALENYNRSLELDPGNINLALRRSRLLETMNRNDEAVAALNAYSRTFPDSPAVMTAQAKWLDRNNRRDEARELMRNLVRQFPEDIESRLFLQELLDSPRERYDNLRELRLLIESDKSRIFGFGKEITSAELLTSPESSIFLDFIRDTAYNSPHKLTRELYSDLLPVTNSIAEDFSTGKLSDHWTFLGGLRPLDQGRYELKAAADTAESYLRLRKSELIRDGAIEVDLDESTGFFWIYARRSTKSMVRFGFDNEGFIHLQSWRDGNLAAHESKPWMRPAGLLSMKLEIRGDGAMGYANGNPVFMSPVRIPRDIAYGWWGIAPFSLEYGAAEARVSGITVTPLPPAIALMPELSEEDMSAALDLVRLKLPDISALAPSAFRQQADGSMKAVQTKAVSFARMFATFHRLRFMPIAEMAYHSDINPTDFIELINRNNLDAMIILVRILPDKEWFDSLERALESTTANVVVIRDKESFWPAGARHGARRGSDAETTHFREIQRGNLLAPPLQSSWELHPVPFPAGLDAQTRRTMEPRLYIIPRRAP